MSKKGAAHFVWCMNRVMGPTTRWTRACMPRCPVCNDEDDWVQLVGLRTEAREAYVCGRCGSMWSAYRNARGRYTRVEMVAVGRGHGEGSS
jgi:transposase-like protein